MRKSGAVMVIEGSSGGGARIFVRDLVLDRETGAGWSDLVFLVGWGPVQEVRAAAQWLRGNREPYVRLQTPDGEESFPRSFGLPEGSMLSFVRLPGNFLGLRILPDAARYYLGRTEEEARARFWRVAQEEAVVHPAWEPTLWANTRPLETAVGAYRGWRLPSRGVRDLVAYLLREGEVALPPPVLVVSLEEEADEETAAAEAAESPAFAGVKEVA